MPQTPYNQQKTPLRRPILFASSNQYSIALPQPNCNVISQPSLRIWMVPLIASIGTRLADRLPPNQDYPETLSFRQLFSTKLALTFLIRGPKRRILSFRVPLHAYRSSLWLGSFDEVWHRDNVLDLVARSAHGIVFLDSGPCSHVLRVLPWANRAVVFLVTEGRDSSCRR